MPDFAQFDRRGYPTVSVREGYRDWLPTYEGTVEDAMDRALLERVETVDWSAIENHVDLGCGTGRTGAWLSSRGVGGLTGVDLTPEMLERARGREVFERLIEGDVASTGLPAGEADGATCCLVDEHLEELAPLYLEAARLLRPEGVFVLVGFHPFFIMSAGMPTHFDHPERGPLAMPTHVHLFSDHVGAARAAGLALHELHERVVDDEWVQLKPSWEKHRGWPVSFVAVFRRR